MATPETRARAPLPSDIQATYLGLCGFVTTPLRRAYESEALEAPSCGSELLGGPVGSLVPPVFTRKDEEGPPWRILTVG